MIFLLPRRRPTIPGPKQSDLEKQSDLKNPGNLKVLLDGLYREVNKPDFIPKDPVQFPHRYKNRKDREIAAFLAATIAWGRRDLILKSAEKLFALMGKSPYDFVMKSGFPETQARNGGGAKASGFSASRKRMCIHRTFFEDDFHYFCRGFKACYAKFENLEKLFASAPDIWEGISLFRETMAAANSIAGRGPAKEPRYSKHLSNPEAGSACKRLNLALRWLVRQEGPVDLGVWKNISPASLFIPLDLHVGRSARELGLLDSGRQANDKKAVISLTEKLRAFCPEDPIKYDLALFGYSVYR